MKRGVFKKNYIYLALIFLVFILPAAFIRYPDDRNELKYFVIIDEMIKNKDLLVMRYFGELYPDKPPLYFWVLYFIRDNFKENFFSLGLVFGSVIPAFLVSLLTLNIFGSIIYPIVLISIPFFMGTSVLMRMDMMMSIFILSSLYIFYNMYFGKQEVNKKSLFFMYFMMGVAILVKGGAGIAVPVTAILTLLILDKNLKYLKKINLPWGLLLVIAMLSVWLGALLLETDGKEYVMLLLGRETVGRALKSHAHARPFYYYLKLLPATLAPYSLIFFTGLVMYLKDIKNFKNWQIHEKISFSWFLGPFILFSLISGKLDIYLLPIYPAIAGLIISFYLNKNYRKAFNISLIGSLILVVVISLAGSFIPLPKGLEMSKISIVLGCIIMLGLAVYGIKKKSFYSFVTVPFVIFAILVINLEAYTKYDSLSKATKLINERQEQVIAYRYSDSLNLYGETGQRFITANNIENLQKELNNQNEVLILGRNKYFKDLKDRKDLEVIAKNNKFFLLLYKGN